ncbi:MAG: hypothetical protein ACI9G1_000812 [Pirellulaceae bacterium]|jgi:hypothetical protein
MSDSEGLQYARDMLAFNPAHDSERILRRRAQFFGTPPVNMNHEMDSFQRRQLAEQELEQIRIHFWQTSPAEMLNRLDDLIVDELPDIRAAADRLKQVTRLRTQIDQLAKHAKSRPMMLSALKRIVVLPPRHAGPFRKQILRSLTSSDNLADYKKMARTIRDEFPELYALESDWLTNVERQRRRGQISFGIELPVVILVVAFILFLWILRWIL